MRSGTSTARSVLSSLRCVASSSRQGALSRFTNLRRWKHDEAVRMPERGGYESTIDNMWVKDDCPVLIMGTGKASQFHNKVAQDFGTNIVAATAPGKGGSEFLGKPVYGSVREAVKHEKPYAVSVFVPLQAATGAILECVEAEIPLIVAYAEGIPTHEQLKIQAAIRSQSKSRLVGANCPGMIIPSKKFKMGIQPLAVHKPGCVGLSSRSGTISYELANQTTQLGLGQSVVFGLGGDPFPATRTWEALDWMLRDKDTEVICLVGEVGGIMEEEAALVLKEYRSRLAPGETPKPVVGFVAGQATQQGRMYGHAGAVWWEESERAQSKIKIWEDAGIVMARQLGEVGDLIKAEYDKLHSAKRG